MKNAIIISSMNNYTIFLRLSNYKLVFKLKGKFNLV